MPATHGRVAVEGSDGGSVGAWFTVRLSNGAGPGARAARSLATSIDSRNYPYAHEDTLIR